MEEEAGQPVLIYLHGVGEGDLRQSWRRGLAEGLEEAEYPGLENARIIAPNYAELLRGGEGSSTMPPVTITSSRRERDRVRRDYERRVAALEERIGRHNGGKVFLPAEGVVNLAPKIKKFEQARNYVTDQKVRARVLNMILEQIPSHGRAVLVAHSLGTLIAADLVLRLPAGLHLAGVVTFGSPLGSDSFGVKDVRKNLEHPPANVDWWVNYWSRTDPVSAGHGISTVFPWVLDVPVVTHLGPAAAHEPQRFLCQAVVAQAVGYGLFGSTSREVAVLSSAVDIPLDYKEFLALGLLRYGHLVAQQLEEKGEKKARFDGALAAVQQRIVTGLLDRCEKESRPVSAFLAQLAVAEPVGGREQPGRHGEQPGRAGEHRGRDAGHKPVPPLGYTDLEQALPLLVDLAERSGVEPYDIEVSKKARIAALGDFTAELGLGSKLGTDVFEALDRAKKVLPGEVKRNWAKWGALGVGVVSMATAGLAFLPAAGLTGAAAVTSALAGFGPGGMIGGVLTSLGLASFGTGSLAYGILGSDSSPEMVWTVASARLAFLLLRTQCGLDNDQRIWLRWREEEAALIRAIENLGAFSDSRSEQLKDLQTKRDTIQKAMDFAQKEELFGTISQEEAGEEPAGEAGAAAELERRGMLALEWINPKRS